MSKLLNIYALFTVMLCAVVAAQGEVLFDADFESGAIGGVEFVESGVDSDSTEFVRYLVKAKYDPQNPHDPKAFRSSRWFYFRMSGVEGKRVALTIESNDSRRAMYSYDNVNFHRFSEEESPVYNGEITKKYERDSVFIAYYEPYNYSRYLQKNEEWSESDNVMSFSIGKSGEGREMEALIITNNLHKGLALNSNGELKFTQSDLSKKVVYIHSRIHPSETPSSWMLERVVDRLTSDDESIVKLLDSVIFYIVPFANPDGVFAGRSRTDALGVDLEANYDSPVAQTAPEVVNVKGLLEALHRCGADLEVALNCHAQSSAKCSYWIHSAKSTSESHNRKLKMLAMLSTQQNPYFVWRDMDYSHLKSKFIEGWIFDKFKGEVAAVTFETPYSFYRSRSKSAGWVDRSSLEVVGDRVVDALVDMLMVSTEESIYIYEPRNAKGFKRVKGDGRLYFGDAALMAKGREESIVYHGVAPKGRYRIYRWAVGRDYRNQRIDQNRWESIGYLDQSEDGEFEVVLTSTGRGDLFDLVKVVKVENVY